MSVIIKKPVKLHSARRPADPCLLTRSEAAEYIGVSVSALAHWAMEKRSPVYRVLGRSSYYHMVDLDDWSYSRCGLRRGSR